MKNKIFIISSLLMILVISNNVSAINQADIDIDLEPRNQVRQENQVGQTNQMNQVEQIQLTNQVRQTEQAGQLEQVRTTNQAGQVNQAQDLGVENENQEDNMNDEKTDKQNEKSKGIELNSAIAEQRKSQVALAVQTMLQVADREGGIGQQVRVIAQTQTQNQEKLEEKIQKVQNRSGLVKFLVGSDYKEIKNTREILKQNQQNIESLKQSKNQLVNQEDQQILDTQIKILEQNNLEIENSLGKEEKKFSLFGWLFRSFSK